MNALAPSAGGWALCGRFRRYASAISNNDLVSYLRAGSFLGLRGALPVVQHLRREDNVQGEASDKAVENELIIDLLQGSENARERAGEIVKHLNLLATIKGINRLTYRKCAQLSSSTFTPDGKNLRSLTSNSERTSTSLQVSHRLGVN